LFKKLDILIVKSFLGPFVVTFFVSLFVLVMQFFWLYMDELIGKGLSVWILLQLLSFMCLTLVPLALPLSVLLASIMTFGDMGENFELVAIKSSGISLLRFMRPLGVFMIFVSAFAFVVNNNFIPVANLKGLSMLYDARNSKPTLNIKPDKFNNDIPGFSIRVGSKDEDGYTIRDILIYDHTDLVGNNKVIIAREGQMIPTADKLALIFKLKDGWRYEEGYERGNHAPDYPQTRMHFEEWNKVFDLSSFRFTRNNEGLFKSAYQMMDVAQLSEAIDSLNHNDTTFVGAVTSYLAPYITLHNADSPKAKRALAATAPLRHYDSTFLELVDTARQTMVLRTTANSVRNLKALVDNNTVLEKLQDENLINFGIELHRKLSLSFACFLLFMLGAPLGAIIRKGGLGLPLVVAIAFFITFHMLSISGEKLAKTAKLPPWGGMWMSTFIMVPIAIWLIFTARNDSQIFTKDLYLRLLDAIKTYGRRNKSTELAKK
jgi:lipopolysaccharide export system permease protein